MLQAINIMFVGLAIVILTLTLIMFSIKLMSYVVGLGTRFMERNSKNSDA